MQTVTVESLHEITLSFHANFLRWQFAWMLKSIFYAKIKRISKSIDFFFLFFFFSLFGGGGGGGGGGGVGVGGGGGGVRPFQEYFTYIKPVVHHRWVKTGELGFPTCDPS